jgi:hypothetical protein
LRPIGKTEPDNQGGRRPPVRVTRPCTRQRWENKAKTGKMPLARNPARGITTHEGLDFGYIDRIEITRDGVFETGSRGSKDQRHLRIRRISSRGIDQPAHERTTAADAIDDRDNVISGSAEKRFANPVIKITPAKNLLQIALNQLQLSSIPRKGRSQPAFATGARGGLRDCQPDRVREDPFRAQIRPVRPIKPAMLEHAEGTP